MKKGKTEYGYICQKCGYKVVKISKVPECPLCRLCPRCSQPIRTCLCLEGE